MTLTASDISASTRRIRAGHHLEGAGIDKVADQHAGGVAERRVGGGFAAAHVRFVDDVVMQQRGGMNEFDQGGDGDVLVAFIAQRARRQDGDHRPDALTATADNVIAKLIDERDIGIQLFENCCVHGRHILRG